RMSEQETRLYWTQPGRMSKRFMDAATEGDLETVAAMLKDNPDLIDQMDLDTLVGPSGKRVTLREALAACAREASSHTTKADHIATGQRLAELPSWFLIVVVVLTGVLLVGVLVEFVKKLFGL